jgi:multicomponent Na+:H+ antiporter subunit C
MDVVPFLVTAWLLLVGMYGVVTSRNLIHLVMCLSVAQSSTYVLLLQIGYRKGATAPIFLDVPLSAKATDPIVQALTLTDVVVGVTGMALLLSLALKVHGRTGTLDPNELHPLAG